MGNIYREMECGVSKEQWGNGYWKGVDDAQNGKIKHKFSDEVKYWICHMTYVNEAYKPYDKSLYRVQDLINDWAFVMDYKIAERQAKKVYDYILNWKEPYFYVEGLGSTYISGSRWSDWRDDYFVLPIGTDLETVEKAEQKYWELIRSN